MNAVMVFGLCVSQLSVGPAPQDWKEYKSEEGGFTVLLPGIPEATVRKGALDHTSAEVHNFIVASDSGIFGVSYTSYSEDITKDTSIDKVLDDASDRAVQMVKGKLRSKKTIALNGIPGREITIDVMETLVVRCRIFLIGNNIYSVAGGKHGLTDSDPDVAKCLDSFKLTARKK